MSVLNAINEIKKKDKIKQTTPQVKKTKTTQTSQPQQPKLTPQQIAGLQQMKQSKQVEITKKTTPPPVKTTTPKVPYGTKGNLKTPTGENIPRIVNPIATGITKVASFGTSSLLPGMKEAEAQAQKQFPKSYIAGQVLGYAGPTGLATGLTKGLVKGATKKLATETGKRVVEGAIVGTTAEATQIVKPLITKEITPEQAAKQLATGLVAGAGLDIGIGVLGKVLKALPKSTMNKIKSGATLSKAEKNNIVAELGLPKGTTADDYIRQMQDLAKSDDIVNIPKQREADRVEQYYKSLEKEAPTQRQIVKPIMAQEQSLVKPIAQATDTGKAKPFTNLEMNPIVEEPKQPKQYFTGSSNPEIKTFVPGGDGSTKISGDSYGKGVYLTSNPDVAKSYAQGERGKVYNIEFENPVLDLDEKANEKFVDTVYESLTNSDKQYRNRIIKEIPYTETSFDTSDEAIKYYDEMENVWKQEDGVYEANKPEPEKVGNKFIVKHKDFKTDLKTNLSNMTNREIFESISKINTDSATDLVMQSGFDGIEFLDSGAFQSGIEGKTAVIYRNTDKFKVDQPIKPITQATEQPTPIVKPLIEPTGAKGVEPVTTKPDEILTSKIPFNLENISENDIKNGMNKYVSYDPYKKNEASYSNGKITVGDSFFNLNGENQKSVLSHEVSHGIAEQIPQHQINDMSDIFSDIFKNRLKYEKLIGENAYQKNYDEVATELINSYITNNKELLERYPKGYELADALIKGKNIKNTEIYKGLQIKEEISKEMSKLEEQIMMFEDFKKENPTLFLEKGWQNKLDNLKTQQSLEPVTQSVEQPTPIVKPLIEPTATPQVKTPVIEPQGVKSVAEKMSDAKESIEVPIDSVSKEKFRRTTEYSIKNSQLPDDLKQAVKGNTYKEITNQESWDKAWDKVSNNLEGSKAGLKAKTDLSGADDTMEYIALLNKTARTNISEAKALAEDFAEKATRGGQAIQAISTMQKLTPEGQLIRAMSVKNAAEREFAKNNPAVFDKFKKLDDQIKQSVEDAKIEIADNVINKINDEVELFKDAVSGKTKAGKYAKSKINKTPEQMLADRIKGALKPKDAKEIDEINQMVSSLFSKAKPKLGIEKLASRTTDKFKLDVKNRQQYASVWQNAKNILRNELDPDMVKQIDDYFETGVRPTFKEAQLNTLIKNTMQDLGINLSDTVKKFATNQITDRNIIKETLLKELNLDADSAEYLSKFIEKNLKDAIKDKRERLLANYFKDFKTKTPSDQPKKIQDIVNLGGLENTKYVEAFKTKLPPVVKQMLKDRNIKMLDILKLSREAQGNVTDDMVSQFLRGLDVDVKYYDQIKDAADSAFRELSEKTRQSYINKMFREPSKRIERPLRERISELYNLDVLNDLAREKYGIPYFTDDEAKYIVDTMENASMLEGRKKAIELAKVDGLIANKTPASLWDKGIALRNMNLLGNFKTLFSRNPVGNLIFMGLENVSQIPSGLADIATSKALGTERTTKVLPSIGTQLKGMGTGVKETFEDMINNVDTSPTRGGAELPRNRKVFKTEALNKVNNFIGDMLKLGDRPFYQAAFDLRVKELKELRPNMSDEEINALANAMGLERTFQNDTVTSKALGKLKKDVLNLGKEHGLGDIVIPFSQTPANILQKGVEYTPLNALNVAGKLLGQGLGKETIRNNPKAFTDAVGRTFTGTSLMALGYNFMKNGYISGGTSEMSPKEKALNKEIGKQQYSIKIGDKWYSYDWSQPASIPIAVGADMYQSGMKEEDFLKQLESGFTGGVQTLFNQSVMQGVLRMFGSNTIAGGLLDAVSGAPSQFVPTLGSQAAQTSDPYKRDVDYSNILTTAKTSVQKKIPGLRQQLPATISMFGEPVEEQGRGVAKALKVFFSPSNVSDETTDKITKDIYNLYKRTGETDVIPSKMPTGLSKEQEREFKILFGQDVKKNLERLMTSDFNLMTDDMKVKRIKKVIDDSYSRSKDKLGIGKKQ